MCKETPDAAKSLWTMEIEERLVAGDIDIIVHSLKDIPTVLPRGSVCSSPVSSPPGSNRRLWLGLTAHIARLTSFQWGL
jgi:hypothetical protein